MANEEKNTETIESFVYGTLANFAPDEKGSEIKKCGDHLIRIFNDAIATRSPAMPENKHTTGPWCVDRHGTGKEWLVIMRRSDGKEIACIREVHNQSDAKLIAAAPNLLQSLKRLVERVEKCGGDPWREMAEARSTIDMAEGKPHANH